MEVTSGTIARKMCIRDSIGTSQWEAEPSKKVLVMNLEKDAAAIGWGVRENKSDDTFTAMFLYANKKYQGYYPGKFYMHGDLDMRGYLIENFSLDPDNMVVNNGANADCLLLRPGAINTDGTINPAYAKQVRIQNGFIVSG